MPNVSVEQALQQATLLQQRGKLTEAESICRQILARHASHPQTLHLLGVIFAQTSRFDLAASTLRQAIALRPDWAEASYNLGNLLQITHHLDEAIAAYRKALARKPYWPEALNNLGLALKENGQIDEAIQTIEQAIVIKADLPSAWTNLGNVCKAAGRFERSIAAYRRAIELKPDLPEAHNNLAVVLMETGDPKASAAAAREAVRLRPDFAEAHNNLGTVLEEMGQLDEAVIALRRAIELNPRYADAQYNLGNVLKSKRLLNEAISCYRQAIALKPGFVQADNNLVYALHFHPAYDAAAIAAEHRRWNHQHAQPLKHLIKPFNLDRDPNRRLRIGYVSPDFKEHPVGRFLLPLLINHDRKRFEIFAYSQVPIVDPMTESLRAHTDAWRNIVGLSDAQTAELIREDRIDILIDLTMHMARNRLLVFARKPAPVQATWLAYCSTTGLETIDYRISDPYLDLPGLDESIYTEKTIRLPKTYWCYQPLPNCPPVEIPPADRAITFGCLNNFSKVSDAAICAWAKIVRAVPDSRLLLHAPEGDHRDQLVKQFSKHEIHPDRIHFTAKVPTADYFRLYHQIDIALDTFPYAGGTTTCDALWMAVPVVTLVGNTAVGRGGLSILSNLGLTDLAAHSEADYIAIAMELAKDRSRMNQLRQTLRAKMERSPLMDGTDFARAMEAIYLAMWNSDISKDFSG
jgi:predicted O-linked N-acetylglucosamine transferase (SPINDLY family)